MDFTCHKLAYISSYDYQPHPTTAYHMQSDGLPSRGRLDLEGLIAALGYQ
jgi:hypothetical protein